MENHTVEDRLNYILRANTFLKRDDLLLHQFVTVILFFNCDRQPVGNGNN
jgi:hypothetical protein